MDAFKNPFSPGAGTPPPELVGREVVLESAQLLFRRVKNRRSEKSLMLTGLRGVGKTVLLLEMQRLAMSEGYRTLVVEAHAEKSLPQLLAPAFRSLLLEFDRSALVKDKIRRGIGVLKGFVSALKVTVEGVTYGIDIEPERGTADSGDLELDLPALFVTLGEVAQDTGCAIAILIDEIQYFSAKELGALIMAMHKIQQQQLPLVLLGAGLPILPGLAGESKSYAERLFHFPSIDALSPEDAAKALQEPAQKEGVFFEEEALEEIFRFTRGYPYFVQEWGYQTWNQAPTSPISLQIVKNATPKVMERLDHNFFRVRFDRLTPSEKRFLRAMAQTETPTQRISDVAERLNMKITALGPVRAKLIKKGMIYSPAYGEIAFTVPLFDDFMRRSMPAEDRDIVQ